MEGAKGKKAKKDFDRERMYRKIMPSSREEGKPAPPVTNLMEEMVLERLPQTVKILQGCPCERCKRDVACVALNRLPPAFVTLDGEDLDKKSLRTRRDREGAVMAALVDAVQQVKKNPRH